MFWAGAAASQSFPAASMLRKKAKWYDAGEDESDEECKGVDFFSQSEVWLRTDFSYERV